MQYNPKLKKAMEEIKAILDKHDIAAFISLHTPGNGETLFKLDPSYSCAKISTLPTGEMAVKIQSNKEAYRSPEKRHQVLSDTVNMFATLEETLMHAAFYMNQTMGRLESELDINRGESGFTTDTTQNN